MQEKYKEFVFFGVVSNEKVSEGQFGANSIEENSSLLYRQDNRRGQQIGTTYGIWVWTDKKEPELIFSQNRIPDYSKLHLNIKLTLLNSEITEKQRMVNWVKIIKYW